MKSRALESLDPEISKKLTSIGENIQSARKKRKISQSELANKSDISVKTLRSVENGDPSVGIGIYGVVLSNLGLANDLDLIGLPDPF